MNCHRCGRIFTKRENRDAHVRLLHPPGSPKCENPGPGPSPVVHAVLAVAAGLTMFLLVHAYDQAHQVEPQLLAYGSALLSLLSVLVAWEVSGI